MRAALPSFTAVKAAGTVTRGASLLDPGGARTIIGWNDDALAAPIVPSAASLFGPRGVCLHRDGSFWVCDTGHHRLLGWPQPPGADNAPAGIVVGQRDFRQEGRNGRGAPGAATLNVPTGVSAWGPGLAVADAWNHRVLLWRERPVVDNQDADIILGQDDPAATHPNRGGDAPTGATLHWPYGVAEIGGMLLVADTGNRRVMVWADPQRTGQAADLVLGQADMVTRDENAGGAVNARGMRWPHGIAFWQGMLAVADAGNNRVMLWDGMPQLPGAPCDRVLGQSSFSACDHNRGAYYPSASALNMPYGIATAGERLIIADTANSRLIGVPDAGGAADRLTGQADFACKGDNGWGLPGRDRMCWPYGLSVAGSLCAVADSGNNRVLLWDLAG